ncbi:hypothetical protein BGZ65_000425, partial [Modicella reniformis]
MHEALKIPPCKFEGNSAIFSVYVDKAELKLIVLASWCVMVWKLPTTFEEDAILLSALWTLPRIVHPNEMSANQIWNNERLKTCRREQIHITFADSSGRITSTPLCRALARVPFRFSAGVISLIHMFGDGNDTFRQAVLNYVGRYINRTVKCNNQPETILTFICKRVKHQNYAIFDPFLKALFNSVHVRWVPGPGLRHEMNPILLLLDVAKTIPRAINLAQT